ncbi:MAG TPA: glutamate--tRNA ligase, partial [Chitinophagaceae bacterium]|nr:glutamate--tRNA ligase [Chitinophagaceae bacterium]
FDYEKAKWFNHEWIKRMKVEDLNPKVSELLVQSGITITNKDLLDKIITLVKDRCTLLTDFIQQSTFFFKAPEEVDVDAVKPKWSEAKKLFFAELIRNYELAPDWNAHTLETNFKEIASVNDLKPGELMLPFRIMLVGGKFGPGVFEIAELLGKEETIKRMQFAISKF